MKLFVCLVLCLVSVLAEYEELKSPLESPRYKEFWDSLPTVNFPNKFNRTGKITGGQVAERHQFPHQAALILTDIYSGTYLCGGSLISENFVLTAAHCLEDINSVQVFLGAFEFRKDALWKGTFPKQNLIIHENYNSRNIWNDIGLIKISGLELIPGKIETIKLLPKSLESEHFIGTTNRISGWGKFGDRETTSLILRFVDLQVRELQYCKNIFGSAVVRDSNICTTGIDTKSTCGGDSGGPFYTTIGSNRYQIGVVSFGAAAGCELGYPSVFTRVGSYLDWIKINSGVTF